MADDGEVVHAGRVEPIGRLVQQQQHWVGQEGPPPVGIFRFTLWRATWDPKQRRSPLVIMAGSDDWRRCEEVMDVSSPSLG